MHKLRYEAAIAAPQALRVVRCCRLSGIIGRAVDGTLARFVLAAPGHGPHYKTDYRGFTTCRLSTSPVSRMPDTYLVIGAVALFAYALSSPYSPGAFSVQEQLRAGVLVPIIDPDSFRFVAAGGGLPLFSSDGSPALFNAISRAWSPAVAAVVRSVSWPLSRGTGGSFGVVLATGAVNRGLGR